jgi:excisionase family DNA binding protein
MSEELYTVEQAAERLKLHPKTVLRLIRTERLRGTRIGKSYRILRSNLEAFAGVSREAEPHQARVTSVIELSDIPVETASRLATALQAALVTQVARPEPVHLNTAYDPQRRQLKIVIIAAPVDTAALLQLLQTLLSAF